MHHAKLLLQKLMGIDIIKVFSLNAMSALIRMACGMISVKVVAVIIGPAGIALLGQLSNFNTILLGLSNGGISSGVTKYVAEYKDDESQIKRYLSNALRITLISSLIMASFLILGCLPLSRLILQSDEYYYVFLIIGITLFLYTFNGLLLSVLNGYKTFELFVKVSVTGTVIGLVYSVALVYFLGLPGALINAATFQSIMLFVTLWMCRKLPWLRLDYFKEKIDSAIVKRYLGYSLMTLTTLSLLPVSQLLLRGYVMSEISETDAGIWEGMNRISSMYLSVITTAFSVYYLPRLSEIQKQEELRHEIFLCYKIIIPMLVGIGVTIYLLRHFILWLLFTPAFYPMEDLFSWQLLGDLFKMSSWMLAYIMVAKAKTRMFIATEITFTLSYVVLAFVFLKWNGIVGLTQGYLCCYVLYLIAMVFLFRSVIKVKHV